MTSADRRLLLVFLAVFLLSRLIWVSWNPISAVYWEEAYRFVAAQELLNEPTQALLDYQADHYQGGSLVMILLTTGFFFLFGESLATLKLAPLLFSTATLAMLFVIGRTWFDRPTAVLASAAYVAGPPLVAYWGLVPMGSHGESILFSLVQIHIVLGMLLGRWRGPRAFGLLGLVSGLGIWFCYTSFMSLAACGLCWLLLEGVPRWRELGAAVGGLALGLVPWLVYNATRGFPGFVRVLELFGLGDPVDPWAALPFGAKVSSLVTHDWPLGLVVPVLEDVNIEPPFAPSVAVALMVAFCVPQLLGLLGSLARVVPSVARWARDRALALPAAVRVELPFALYGAVFLGVFLGSSFTVDRDVGIVSYRLFLPPTVILSLPIAFTLARTLENGSRRLLGVLLCIAWLGSSAVATVGHVLTTQDLKVDPPMGYAVMGLLAHRKYENDLEGALEIAHQVPIASLRYKVAQGVGWGLGYRYEKDGDLEGLWSRLEALPPVERAPLLSGLLYTSGVRLTGLRELIALGRQEPRYPVIIERLEKLDSRARRAWNELPVGLRMLPEWDPRAPGQSRFTPGIPMP